MKSKVKFSNAWLENLATPGVRTDYADINCPGLVLRVSSKGIKSFSFTYRYGSKTGRITFGKFPVVSLKLARDLVAKQRIGIANGIDPRGEKVKRLQAKELKLPRMVDEYIKVYAEPRNKTWKQAQDNLRLYLISYFGDKPIGDINREGIHKILDDLAEQGKRTTCNRVRAHMNGFFSWCVERGYLEVSPTQHIRPRFKEISRDRVLSEHEIRSIWEATQHLSEAYRNFVKLLFLCGQRKRVTADIRKSQIKDGIWTIEARDSKNNQTNIVSLTPRVASLIEEIKDTKHDYLLRSGQIGDHPINGFSKAKTQIDKESKVKDWRWHDIRRTVTTNLAMLGHNQDIIRRLLNHSNGSVTGIYDRYSYLEERRAALTRWEDKLEDILK
jgi:integrase